MGIRDNAINMFGEQRALTDDEMQAYKDMLRRKENDMGVKWEDFKWSNINYTVPTNKVLTDILCPNCGKPIYMRTDKILTSDPAQYQYECVCGWVGYSPNKWQKGLGE